MKIKLAFDLSRVDVPKTFVERITKSVPEEHLKQNPIGKENVIFEQYIHNILLEFKDDISAVCISNIEHALKDDLQRSAKSFKMEVLKKEDGDVSFITCSVNDEHTIKEEVKGFLKSSDKIEKLYCIIPVEFVANAYKNENIPEPWNMPMFYKQAFGIFLKNLKEVLSDVA